MGPADYVGAARMVGHGVHTWYVQEHCPFHSHDPEPIDLGF